MAIEAGSSSREARFMASPQRTVVCFGASLTAGTVSCNYLELLAARPALAGFRFVNHGVNGDVAWKGLQRVDQAIAERPDDVAILIGTNDVNSTLSERNLRHYLEFYQVPQVPTLDWYEESLRAIVRRFQAGTSARIALLSLAVIGEDLEHEANRRIAIYNQAVRRVAQETHVAYLPLHEQMVAYLQEHEADRAALPPRLQYRDGLINIGNATALHAQGLSWDDISRRNGLLITTDTFHLNSMGAGMIAGLIEAWLLKG
jgi:lysophospholipase L1-like esterase